MQKLRAVQFPANPRNHWPFARIQEGIVPLPKRIRSRVQMHGAASLTEVIMMRNRLWRWIRVSLLAATVSLAFGSMAWGQSWGRDDDDRYYDRRDEAREHGYRNGYRDGLRAGQYDAERGRRFKFKNDDWEDSRGYEHWMGHKGHYKHEYREGYERGYRRAYGTNRRYRDRYDDRWHDRNDWR